MESQQAKYDSLYNFFLHVLGGNDQRMMIHGKDN